VVNAALEAFDVCGVDEELGAMGFQEGDGGFTSLVSYSQRGTSRRTLVQFEVCNGLPLIGRDEPLVGFAPTAEVDNELGRVVVERLEDGLEAFHGEGRVGEQVRCDNDLLRSN
jgi:hypothetical protein